VSAPLLLVALLTIDCIAAGDECTNGEWSQAPNQLLEAGRAVPHVQCWRNPPCARHSYATVAECGRRKTLADWHSLLGPDPHIKDASVFHDFGDLLHEHLRNKVVIVVGDSISSLVFDAALCEAAKNATVVDVFDPRVKDAGVTAAERFRDTMHAVSRSHDTAKLGPLWVGGGPHHVMAILETGTLFVQKGWHKWGEYDMAAVLRLADVVLVNYGLHYAGNMTEFEEAAPLMLAQLDAWAAASQPPGSKLALWRDTAEEHVNVELHEPNHGYLDSEIGHPDANKTTGCQCAAERPKDRPSMPARINGIVAAILPRFPRVGKVPFYELTQPRWNMHEAAFCSFEGLTQTPGEPHFCWCAHSWNARR
jgi:hypothetical protein